MGTQSQDIILKNLAVLVIDMQYDFIDTEEKKRLIPNQISILNFCNDKKIPVAVIEFSGHLETIQNLKEEIMKLQEGYVCSFKKHYDDAFSVRSLDEWLKKHKVKTLLLMGVNGGGCVHKTASSAIQNGYTIITSKNLIAGFCDNPSHLTCVRFQWFEENGLCFDNHMSFLKQIAAD